MDTKALRQKILDLAIRGKLVPQDPNDEPASVLLERIRAEKQQMVKDGRLKAKDVKNDTVIFVGEDNLHYEKFADGTIKCIEDEIPFEVPEGWEWCRFTSFASMMNGTSKRTGKDGHSTIVLRLADLGEDNISYADCRSVSLTEADIAKYSLQPNDLLFIRVNGSKSNVGKSYLFPESGTAVAFCDHIIRARTIPVILPSLLCNYMRSGYARTIIEERIVSAAGQNTISQPSLSDILIPIPPYDEQIRQIKAIEEALSYIRVLEDGKGDLSSIIENAKSKILDLAIRGKLVPQSPDDEPASVLLDRIRAEKDELIKQGKIKRDKRESVIFRGEDNSYYEKVGEKVRCIDDSIPFDLPEGWIWSRGHSCFVGMETRRPSGAEFDYIDIDSIDNHAHAITVPKHLSVQEAPSRASRAVQAGSVLFSLVRPYLQNIAFVLEKHSECIASTGFYVCTSNGLLLPEYMYYLMLSPYVVDGLNQFMKGDNSPSISKDDIENWLFPVPPLAEQIRIASKVQHLITQTDNIESALA